MQPGEPSLPTKILAVTAGMLLLVLGFMFSLVILALIGVVGLFAWGYFRWKTRNLRKAMKQGSGNGQVIDGEAIVIEESRSIRSVTDDDISRKPD